MGYFVFNIVTLNVLSLERNLKANMPMKHNITLTILFVSIDTLHIAPVHFANWSLDITMNFLNSIISNINRRPSLFKFCKSGGFGKISNLYQTHWIGILFFFQMLMTSFVYVLVHLTINYKLNL